MMLLSAQHETGLARVVRTNLWALGLVLLHWGITVFTLQHLGLPYQNDAIGVLMMLFGTVIPVFVFILILARVVHMLRHVRPARPSAWLLADLRATVFDLDRMASGTLALLLFSLFFTNFSTMKAAIPHLTPYAWDVWLADLDQALHFGQDPWALLMPLFGAPAVLAVLNAAYVIWLFALYFVVFVACFTRSNPVARMGFMLAFLLTWSLGGNLVAIGLASVGPVYFEPLGLGDRFAPLMDHLHAAHQSFPLASLAVQDMLWDGYQTGQTVSGISAFPSMHVASSTLLALYAFTYRRWAGWLMTGFAITIQIGSVMLGWHYAVDGYAGALIAYAAWRFGLYAARRWLPATEAA